MELYYIFIIISVLTSAISEAFTITSSDINKDVPKSLARVKRDMGDKYKADTSVGTGYVVLPTWSIIIIGLSMLFMLIAIVVLAVTLYLAWKKKWIFELDASNKQYVRQELTGVTPLYNSNYDEQNKNNGSTLTVNSGIIEISEPRTSEPITPTRLEDSKIVFAKRPLRPVMHKGQMDAICQEVLRKVQKSDSASFRDLNELLKFGKKEDNFEMKSEDVIESEKENKTEEKTEFNIESQKFKLKKPEMKKENQTKIKSEAQIENEIEIKDETKQETKNETTNETKGEAKPDESKDVRIEVDKVESDKNEDDSGTETEYDTVPSPIKFRHSGSEPDQTMYDTVPNPMKYRHSGPEPDQTMYDTVPNPVKYRNSGPMPDQTMYDIVPNPMKYRHSGLEPDQAMYDTVASPKRFRHSGAETSDDIDDIPLYDLPPTKRSQGDSPRNVIQMDPESHYLFPISTEKTDSCYVNAKRQSFKSP